MGGRYYSILFGSGSRVGWGGRYYSILFGSGSRGGWGRCCTYYSVVVLVEGEVVDDVDSIRSWF